MVYDNLDEDHKLFFILKVLMGDCPVKDEPIGCLYSSLLQTVAKFRCQMISSGHSYYDGNIADEAV